MFRAGTRARKRARTDVEKGNLPDAITLCLNTDIRVYEAKFLDTWRVIF